MTGSKNLICTCGAPLVSDGQMFRCPLRGGVNAFCQSAEGGAMVPHRGDEVPDLRYHSPLAREPWSRRPGRPGRPFSKVRRCRKARLHAGLLKDCPSCHRVEELGKKQAAQARHVDKLKARFAAHRPTTGRSNASKQ